MKFSEKRFAQIWNIQVERGQAMTSAEAFAIAIELFRKEVKSDDIERFEEWLATDPALDVSSLSHEDRLGYAAYLGMSLAKR